MQTRLSGGRPLYKMARAIIEERVRSGVYKPEEPLPSVLGLASELHVSGITVRRALADLQNAGLLRAVPGLGTFVNTTRRFVRHLNRVRDPHYGAFEEALHIGKTATTRTLSVELRDPKDPVFNQFEIADAKHICINRLILIDDEPMAMEHTFVTMPIEQDFIDNLAEDLLYRVLRKRNMPLSDNRLYFDAAPASPQLSSVLGVPVGYPTIRHFYNPVVKSGEFSIYGVSISPFDRLGYKLDLPI